MKGDFSLNNMRASARVVFYCLQKKREKIRRVKYQKVVWRVEIVGSIRSSL
jgi:hypothetical protein